MRIVFGLLALVLLTSAVAADVRYKSRGQPANRYEGVVPVPVSGYDVELLSVRLYDRAATLDRLPKTLSVSLKQALEPGEQVDLVVR